MRKRKIKFMIACAVCCMAIAMPVMAKKQMIRNYAIGPNDTKTLEHTVFNVPYIYIDTRPIAGGDIMIELSGGASGGTTFSYYTLRSPWKVMVTDQSVPVVIKGTASSCGTAGTLVIKDD